MKSPATTIEAADRAVERRATRKAARRVLRPVRVLVPLAIIAYFVPWLAAGLVACGIVDFARNRRWDRASVHRYFFGNGLFTWLLSPINLFADLLSRRNRYIYRIDELPAACRGEIESVIGVLKSNDILEPLKRRMADRKRGMMFFKWYGRNIDNTIHLPEFDREFAYVRTIGVSTFNRREATSTHFGPLRFTLRVLYNLDPSPSDAAYIEVRGERHVWRDDPLFIFDDTLMHRSVNDTDDLRYCMFVDILRPSRFTGVLAALLALVRMIMLNARGVFYKNWDLIS